MMIRYFNPCTMGKMGGGSEDFLFDRGLAFSFMQHLLRRMRQQQKQKLNQNELPKHFEGLMKLKELLLLLYSERILRFYEYTPRVQVPNNHILSKILTYITTILKPSTQLLGPLDPWGNTCNSSLPSST